MLTHLYISDDTAQFVMYVVIRILMIIDSLICCSRIVVLFAVFKGCRCWFGGGGWNKCCGTVEFVSLSYVYPDKLE